MLNDNRDKQLMRNQLIAVLIMTVVVLLWTYFFMPPPTPRAPLPPTPAPVEAPSGPANTPSSDSIARALPPAAPETQAASGDVIVLENESLRLAFTPVGARLQKATVLLGKEGEDSTQLVPLWEAGQEAEAVYPLGIRFAESVLGEELNRRPWEAVPDAGNRSVTFQYTIPDELRIEKTYRLGDNPGVLDISVSVTNLRDQPMTLGEDDVIPAYSLYWGPNVTSGDINGLIRQEVIWRKDDGITHIPTSSLKEPEGTQLFSERVVAPEFVGIKSAYFLVALKPEFDSAVGWVRGAPERFRVGLGVPRTTLTPGQTQQNQFRVYMGPTHLEQLQAAWPGLDSTLQFFTSVEIMDHFAKFLLGVMNWFHDHVISNYGLAIIFLTLVIRIVLFPLTYKSTKSMKRMQKLAPELEKIKAEVGDNPQEYQKRIMALYKERGLNPLGGCFPLLLQMPVFIAFYRMIGSAYELRHAPFILWIRDLSQPDRLFTLPFEIPIPFARNGIDAINLLPVLMALSMVLSQKLMPASGPVQNPQQKLMMTLMPILFSLITYNMAAALNLYILTSTLMGIGQNYLIHVTDEDLETKKKPKAAKRPKHFYNAAQARKREIAKEIRREKRTRTLRDGGKVKGDESKKRP